MEKVIENSLVVFLDKTQVEPETRSTLLQSFENFFIQTQEWKEKAEGLVITSVEQKEEIKQAKEARLALKSIRVNTEHKRKELKEESLRKGQTIDAIAKIITNEILPIEEHLEKQEKYAELQEAKRKAELRDARLEELLQCGVDGSYFDLANMPEENYSQFLCNSQVAYEAKLQAAIQSENERIAREKAEADERAERLRLEAENRAKIEAENKKLKEEADAREREFEAERKQREIERLAEEEKLRKERELAALEAKRLQAEHNAKLEAERKEREAIQAELKAKQELEAKRILEEQEREEAELSRGDKDKFGSLISDIDSLKGKYSFKSKKYKTLQSQINDLLNKTVVFVQSKIN